MFRAGLELLGWLDGWMDGERTRLATFHSRPAGKPPRKVLADIHAQMVVRCWELKGEGQRLQKNKNKKFY